jgi:hypothetical protein
MINERLFPSPLAGEGLAKQEGEGYAVKATKAKNAAWQLGNSGNSLAVNY